MNLGIIIAVSEYTTLGNNLPGCKIDGEIISKIIKSDQKFDDVLIITKNTESVSVKQELIQFVDTHKQDDINEVVFYFTGHGDFCDGEFYYLLSDYDKKRRKQTSLENSELDSLLKNLSPNTAVKIVDACHSGTPYIKDMETFDSYLKGTQGKFNKCYFMFSSQSDQHSYQDENLSFFTRSIAESIYKHESDSIRYKDIIDFVSDSFSDKHSQTPFFVVQADFTELFCSTPATLKNAVKGLVQESSLEFVSEEGSEEKKSLSDIIKADANRYCTEDEAKSHVVEFMTSLENLSLRSDISKLYDTLTVLLGFLW